MSFWHIASLSPENILYLSLQIISTFHTRLKAENYLHPSHMPKQLIKILRNVIIQLWQ